MLQRLQGGVEAARQPAELVLAGDLHALGQVQPRAERLGAAGEAPDRRERRPRHHRAERGRERDARGSDRHEDRQHPVELPVHLVQRPRDLHRPARTEAQREDAQMVALDVGVGELHPGTGPCDRQGRRPERQCRGLAWRPGDGAAGIDQLDEARRPPEGGAGRLRRLGPRLPGGAPGRGAAGSSRRGAAGRPPRHHLGGGAQRPVDLAAQLRADGDVDGRGDREHGDRDGQAGHRGDPQPQAHGSRSE
jgi:hypothetical protein